MSPFNKVILALAVVALVTTWPKAMNDNDKSRMATIQSLVESRSLTIEDTAFSQTGDKVFVDGHFYSDKPMMTAVFGAAVYYPLHRLGLTLAPGWNAAYYLITLVVVKGSWLAGLIAFYHALGFTTLAEKTRIGLMLALGVGSLYFAWSSTYNNHSVAAALLSCGFYFILAARHCAINQRVNLAWAGFFLSLAGTTDVPTGAFYAGFLVSIIADRRLRPQVACYLLPLAATVMPALALNYGISGSLIPVGMVRAYFEYPGSKWVGAKGAELSGIGINRWAALIPYAFNTLIGSKGFILYNPLLFPAIPSLVRECRPQRKFRSEALTVGIVSALIVSYYLLFTNNYGGWSYSIRWFVPLLPLLYFFLHPFVANAAAKRNAVFATLFAVSAAIAIVGLYNPWSKGKLSTSPLVANLRQMAQDFDAVRRPWPARRR